MKRRYASKLLDPPQMPGAGSKITAAHPPLPVLLFRAVVLFLGSRLAGRLSSFMGLGPPE